MGGRPKNIGSKYFLSNDIITINVMYSLLPHFSKCHSSVLKALETSLKWSIMRKFNLRIFWKWTIITLINSVTHKPNTVHLEVNFVNRAGVIGYSQLADCLSHVPFLNSFPNRSPLFSTYLSHIYAYDRAKALSFILLIRRKSTEFENESNV